MSHHSNPFELRTEVSEAVYTVDLDRLADLLDISSRELVAGFHATSKAHGIHSVLLETGQTPALESIQTHQMHRDRPLALPYTKQSIDHSESGDFEILPVVERAIKPIRQVLLTTVARSIHFGSREKPKCLMVLGNQTVMSHILAQLHSASIEKAVILIAAEGDRIIKAVKKSEFFDKMNVTFLDLGPESNISHAESILAARGHFGQHPFMVHTADRIYDKAILNRVLEYKLNEAAACALIEMDTSQLIDLPSTAVRIQTGGKSIIAISRSLEKYNAIEAGLFLMSDAIFPALEKLVTTKAYFSLADALSSFVLSDQLAYLPTLGQTWFSIETRRQFDFIVNNDSISRLKPWNIVLSSPATQAHSLDDKPKSSNRMFVITAQEESQLDLEFDSRNKIEGFVVPVKQSDRGVIHHDTSDNTLGIVNDQTPLLWSNGDNSEESTPKSPKVNNGNHSPTFSDSVVVTVPLDENAKDEDEDVNRNHQGYLIELKREPRTPITGTDSKYMLALPTSNLELETDMDLMDHSILPSHITGISLETSGQDDNLQMMMIVKRRVPIIGYVILVSALIAISSVGVALDMESGVSPFLKLMWRNGLVFLLTLPLTIFYVPKETKPIWTRHLMLEMLIVGASYAFFIGSYVVSLSLTSVGHATLFNNAHSLLIVLIKLLSGRTVLLFEGIGAIIGVLGGACTTMDTVSVGESRGKTSPTAIGDFVALIGALGGAVYLIYAKKMRSKMHILVFLNTLTCVSTCVLFLTLLVRNECVELSMDSHYGIFGWLNPRFNRLGVTLYLIFVCDLIGTTGYITAMKYFEPIVISIVCLLEPIVATFMGILTGFDSIPGTLTVVGGSLVLLGTFFVISAQNKHHAREKIDASAAATPKLMRHPRAPAAS
uniref:Drug/Metabolite Transporter (DMT) Superfamily putative n=1 Tax=Albugo laibachii Nc14 TaxID=890382 RepID=F0VZ50_9STRA|nr:Drug/Metabolite Transporter (DMT) Superfamily putative [Albugo laibachii Nc14]|eukprot:CCA14065.1 Drug/Metabolite Transporter (DMT) Superfamily putative [Albugo laibachii Nc14]